VTARKPLDLDAIERRAALLATPQVIEGDVTALVAELRALRPVFDAAAAVVDLWNDPDYDDTDDVDGDGERVWSALAQAVRESREGQSSAVRS
jgi:hypothetical protein